MALIASEGFDHQNTGADLILRTGALQWTSNATLGIQSPGRGGYGKSCLIASGNTLSGSLVSALTSGYLGFALSNTGMTVTLFDNTSGSQAQVTLVFTASTGVITVFRGTTGGTQIGVSNGNQFNAAAYPFVEIYALIDASAGVVNVQVAGQPVSWSTNPSGVNTKGSSGASSFSSFSIANSNSANLYIDDFRINDTTTGPGTYPCNSWLGDLRVATLFPISNGSVAWTPLANANWQEVSETAFDGDTSYNYATSLGSEDLFNLAALTGTISYVIGVQVVGAFRQTDASAHTITQQIKTGGTDHTGPSKTLAQTYQYFTDMYAVNPVTSASWTTAAVNALEIGYTAVT